MIEIKCTQADKDALLRFMASCDLCLFDFVTVDIPTTTCFNNEDCKTCIERMIKWDIRGEGDV